MVYYFELKDGSLIACSHRGTYMYDGKHWESTTPLNEAEAEYARMIDEDELKQLLDGEEIDITTPVDAPVSYHKKER
ncbi:MAG: hypothetical protein PUD55_03750 [Firmicutes bacterium]|nr:hypothetical protein [Bacillota bacterium]